MSSGSRRRRRSPWRWIWALVVVVGLTMIYFMWPGDDDIVTNAPTDDGAVAAQPDERQPEATARASVSSASAAPSLNVGASSQGSDTASRSQPTTQPSPSPTRTEGARSTPSAVRSGSDPAFREGMKLLEEGKFVEGRAVLSALLFSGKPLPARDAQAIRDTLASINRQMIFATQVVRGDPLVETYTIQRGDVLVRIAPRHHITAGLIQRINSLDPNRLQVGQEIKVVKGPFHAVVIKSQFRMDVYLRDPAGKPIYVRSFHVGLGADNSTPVGSFLVARNGKVQNPGWTNPRTGKTYDRDDPANPIGEYWIGLEGVSDDVKGLQGYGIHGTIEPESIGAEASMGCVRMADDDIALTFDMLVEGRSTVEIRR